LTSSERTNHEQTSTKTAERATETKLLSDLDQSAGGALTRKTLGLVDLGKHGVSWLGDDGGSETSHQARAQIDDGLHTIRGGGLVHALIESLGNLLVDNEFGHCVGDLLEQNGTETTVESTETFLRSDLGGTRHEAGREGGFGDETDTGSLERAESDVGEELRAGGGGEVDGSAVVACSLVADQVDGLLLEQFVTTELECTLKEVTGEGRANTGQEGTSTLILNDFSEATDEAVVIRDGVELDSGLDAGSLVSWDALIAQF
jgi:hypothetical protein